MNLLWMLIPDEALVLLIVVLALGAILGVVRPRTVVGVIGSMALAIIATPFIDAFLKTLPLWLLLALVIVMALWAVRQVFTLLIGERATDGMIGELAADGVRLGIRLLLLPFSLAYRWVRRHP